MPGVLFRLLLVYGFYEAGLTDPNGPFSPVQPANILGSFIMGLLQSTKLSWFVRYTLVTQIFGFFGQSGFTGH